MIKWMAIFKILRDKWHSKHKTVQIELINIVTDFQVLSFDGGFKKSQQLHQRVGYTQSKREQLPTVISAHNHHGIYGKICQKLTEITN